MIDMRAPCLLYYLRIESKYGTLYKIGVTQRSILDRYPPPDSKQITVVRSWRFKLGKWAKAKERQILIHGSDDLYTGPDVLKHGGNSELFAVDVLGLDL